MFGILLTILEFPSFYFAATSFFASQLLVFWGLGGIFYLGILDFCLGNSRIYLGILDFYLGILEFI